MSKSKPRKSAAEKETAETKSKTSSLGHSALHVWQAGLGALGLAQKEGTKLLKALIAEGGELDKKARKHAAERIDAMEQTFDQARDTATGLLGRLEKSFDDRFQAALSRFGVPTRKEMEELRAQLEAFKKGGATPASKRTSAKKPAAKTPAAKKSAAKRAKPAKPSTSEPGA